MSWGLLDMLSAVTIVMFAIPPALLGIEFLVRGRALLGAGLLGAAGLMILVDEYVTTPGDLPVIVGKKLVGAVVRTPDEE